MGRLHVKVKLASEMPLKKFKLTQRELNHDKGLNCYFFQSAHISYVRPFLSSHYWGVEFNPIRFFIKAARAFLVFLSNPRDFSI